MQMGTKGLALLKSFESCELKAFRKADGIWTIGWGHTGRDVVQGLVITQAQADALLAADLAAREALVTSQVLPTVLNQNQFDAVLDLVYNIGAMAFFGSQMLTLIKESRLDWAAAEFSRWSFIKGVQSPGLLRRRTAERDLFLLPA